MEWLVFVGMVVICLVAILLVDFVGWINNGS